MMCQNCEARELDSVPYSLPLKDIQLPALACKRCGCIQLDDRENAKIARLLDAPILGSVRGGILRDMVRQRVAKLMSTPAMTRSFFV